MLQQGRIQCTNATLLLSKTMKNFQNKNNNSEYFALPDAKAAAAARRCRHFDSAQCDSGGAQGDLSVRAKLCQTPSVAHCALCIERCAPQAACPMPQAKYRAGIRARAHSDHAICFYGAFQLYEHYKLLTRKALC